MREDMFKVIVERPRWSSRWAKRSKLRHEHTGKSFIGMKRQASFQTGWCKTLNENLKPLQRYLWKQRGRIWNDVYSEICATLDTGSTVKMHVREHIDDLVERKISIDKNGHWFSCGNGRQPRRPNEWWANLYVDPMDGVLKETDLLLKKLGLKKKRYGYDDVQQPDDQVVLTETCELHQLNGVWYRLTLGPRFESKPDYAEGEWVAVPGRTIYRRYRWAERSRDWRRVVAKQQLGKKELKMYGLKGGAHV